MTPEDFIVEDYKLKLDYFKSHLDRLWTRFNFFLTIEVGLFGFLGWLVFEEEKPDAVWAPAILGLAVSALWYVFAAEDRALVDSYRRRAQQAAERIAATWTKELGSYADHHVALKQESVCNGLSSWYLEKISITRLPVIASVLLFIVWLALAALCLSAAICGRMW